MSDIKTMEGLEGMYSIFLTATCLTMFESIAFYKVVAPPINEKMGNGINPHLLRSETKYQITLINILLFRTKPNGHGRLYRKYSKQQCNETKYLYKN